MEKSVYVSVMMILLALVESICQYSFIGDSLPVFPEEIGNFTSLSTGFSVNIVSLLFIGSLILITITNLAVIGYKFLIYLRNKNIYDENSYEPVIEKKRRKNAINV